MVVDIHVAEVQLASVLAELTALTSVRQRAQRVYTLAEQGKLQHFDLNPSKLDDVAEFVASLIRRDYANPTDVPPHSRWRHFCVGGRDRMQQLIEQWQKQGHNSTEVTRRILDLFVVSVLLDAGAGNAWSYTETTPGGHSATFQRSEGLAVASLDMFLAGSFSSDSAEPCRVDSAGLLSLTEDKLRTGFQVSDHNPLVGVQGRFQLLQRLGQALQDQPQYFPPHQGGPARPGNLLDYLLAHVRQTDAGPQVPVDQLWDLVIHGFASVWPATRTLVNGRSLGDVWWCPSLGRAMETQADNDEPTVDQLVVFHKLSQWLTYSLMEPLTKVSGLIFTGVEHLTGLPEYRNGGLFVDMEVLKLKEGSEERGLARSGAAPTQRRNSLENVPSFPVDDSVIVEWRALTVILLDKTADKVRAIFGLDQAQLPLAQVLEGGTWKAGREIAARLRPLTKGPPISIESDGTVF
ncbi:hypothetical protein IWQ61_000386 [Dispira simplex]|nr:hypothetical protein IWQ61_000386 [Dispira simplex]